MMNILFCKTQQLQTTTIFSLIQSHNTKTRKEMNFPVVVTLLCTVILVQVRELTTSNDVVDYDDRIALLAFKSNIKYDPQSVLTSWNTSTHFCEWQGVTCVRGHKRVAILDLQSRGLVGTLSPYIGNLSFLREIRLSNNTLQGKLPPEIGRLFRLEILDLRYNSHEGEIPINLFRCSNLVVLRLGDNSFVGNIPNGLDSLSKLKWLELSINNFTGVIPHSIGNLTSLEFLYVSYNKFGGSVPDIFHRLTNLTSISLGVNELIVGTIPPSIYNLSGLTLLSMPETQMHGNLPLNIGLLFPKLRFLQLRDCHFSGPIPSSLSNATKLSVMEMGDNNFSGKVSLDFRDMKFLRTFHIRNNNLGTGRPDDLDFFKSLLKYCGKLNYVTISLNSFGGSLLDYIGNNSIPIRALYMISNRIHGHIPSWIGNLTNLEILGMSDNQFTGQIPESVGQLRKLNQIDLNTNRLSGKIPTSMGNCISLTHLLLYGNRLNVNVPPSLGKCKNLAYLFLQENNLSGKIPKEVFEISALIYVNLTQNYFNGFLPSEVGSLKHLMHLGLSDNELSGSIPNSLSGCESLQYLRMRNNFFKGSIPRALSSLKGIQVLDLSHNNLSGEIPKYLETFDLTYLNLSFNDFEGEIPTKGIFTNKSVASLEGNRRLCGGVPDLGLPICSVKEPNRKIISSRPVPIIIIIVCSILGGILLASFIYFRFKRKQNAETSESQKTLMKVSYGMLYKATDGFAVANLIGLGSFGSVFKGILAPDEKIVAIKVLNLQRRGALKSFMAECEALRNIRHRNLVKIITACSSVDYQGNDFKALVYEFMPNENLDMWLHPAPESNTRGNLNLLQRVNIAIDVASSIDYLHHDGHFPIIHCDLKPSNILLDDDMIAHVGDFGIAKFLQEISTSNQISSTGIRGTIGYAPPEYGIGSKVSTTGDIYSFGIVLLEMITGKRPTDNMLESGLNLHNFARLPLSGNLMDILDPILLNNGTETERNTNSSVVEAINKDARDKCLISMVNIGIACSMEAPQDRMDIVAAVRELHLARDILQQKNQLETRRRNR